MSYLLSFWCALLFVVGQGAHAPQLLVWATGAVAFVSLLFGLQAPDLRAPVRHGLSIAIGLLLTAIGIVAWALKSPAWLPFCTLSAAGSYLGVVIAELTWSPRDRGTMAPADADPHRIEVPMIEPGTDEARLARDADEIDAGGQVRPLA